MDGGAYNPDRQYRASVCLADGAVVREEGTLAPRRSFKPLRERGGHRLPDVILVEQVVPGAQASSARKQFAVRSSQFAVRSSQFQTGCVHHVRGHHLWAPTVSDVSKA